MSEEADVLFHEASWTGDWESAAVALHRDLEAARAEVERLKAGGCARDQRLTQHCAEAAEAQREVNRLKQHNEQLKALTGAANEVTQGLQGQVDNLRARLDEERDACQHMTEAYDGAVEELKEVYERLDRDERGRKT